MPLSGENSRRCFNSRACGELKWCTKALRLQRGYFGLEFQVSFGAVKTNELNLNLCPNFGGTVVFSRVDFKKMSFYTLSNGLP